jgi:hypothetical protein
MCDTGLVLIQYVALKSLTAVFRTMNAYIMCIDMHEKYEVLTENKINRIDTQILEIHI